MKILVITQYYFPEQFKINDICETLVKNGHTIQVLTGLPNYPKGIIFDEYKQGKNRIETINGVHIERSYLVGRGSGTINLALNYLSFMVSSSIKTLFMKEQYDAVFVYQLSPVLMAFAGLVYKWKNKVPLYLYCLDLWPESLKVTLKNEESLIYKLVSFISRLIYKKCDKIGVTSKPFINYLSDKHGVNLEKIHYLPQHGYEMFSSSDELYVKHEGINISYFGNIGKAQDFECLVRNIDKVNENVFFHIIGDGSELENLRKLVNLNYLNLRIKLHGYMKKDDLTALYQSTDICFLSLKPDSSIGDTLPSKMIEYLSVGKPVLAFAGGSIKELIEEAECGYCVDFGNDEEFIEKINLLASNRNQRENFGRNGRIYFDEHFTKQQFISNLENQLYDLIGGTKNV